MKTPLLRSFSILNSMCTWQSPKCFSVFRLPYSPYALKSVLLLCSQAIHRLYHHFGTLGLGATIRFLPLKSSIGSAKLIDSCRVAREAVGIFPSRGGCIVTEFLNSYSVSCPFCYEGGLSLLLRLISLSFVVKRFDFSLVTASPK